MNILDYYIEKNKDSLWVSEYQSTSSKKSGKTFLYLTTNYRYLKSFLSQFQKFKELNNIVRENWKTNLNHGQEMDKQRVVNMVSSKLFTKSEFVYNLTRKGEVFDTIINYKFTSNEQWLIIYILLLDSYFGMEVNHIINKTQRVFKQFNDYGLTEDKILLKLKTFISQKTLTKENLFMEDIFWLITFYKDKDFIYLFLNSTYEDKMALYNYVINQSNNSSSVDCIAHKFVQSGQYTVNTFIEDTKVIFFTHYIYSVNFDNDLDFYLKLIEYYNLFFNVSKTKIINFIKTNIDVFSIILKSVFKSNNHDDIFETCYTRMPNFTEKKLTINETPKIDYTTSNSKYTVDKISSILKRIAKEKSHYHCELENLFDCKYFTSKKENENYLEIHHLIPREFQNEFSQSIEILENYIPLCPKCHRLLHFGKNREKESALTYLYNKRKHHLKSKGIDISLKDLKNFYGIKT